MEHGQLRLVKEKPGTTARCSSKVSRPQTHLNLLGSIKGAGVHHIGAYAPFPLRMVLLMMIVLMKLRL